MAGGGHCSGESDSRAAVVSSAFTGLDTDVRWREGGRDRSVFTNNISATTTFTYHPPVQLEPAATIALILGRNANKILQR